MLIFRPFRASAARFAESRRARTRARSADSRRKARQADVHAEHQMLPFHLFHAAEMLIYAV